MNAFDLEEKMGQVSFFGRPLSRVVVSSPSRPALLLIQLPSPKGKSRFTPRRSEFSSASVSTLWPHERQFGGNAGSLGTASQRRSSARWRRARAVLHCQSSASSTIDVSAHRAFGSTIIRFRGLTTPAEDMPTLRVRVAGSQRGVDSLRPADHPRRFRTHS